MTDSKSEGKSAKKNIRKPLLNLKKLNSTQWLKGQTGGSGYNDSPLSPQQPIQQKPPATIIPPMIENTGDALP